MKTITIKKNDEKTNKTRIRQRKLNKKGRDKTSTERIKANHRKSDNKKLSTRYQLKNNDKNKTKYNNKQ